MQKYAYYINIARKNGLKAYNFSQGGMTAGGYQDWFAQSKDYWNPEYAAQAYVLALGVNDIINFDYELGTATDILNALGERVRNGDKFNAGDYVKGIMPDCDVRLDVFEDSGQDVLRVIVPDSNNIFPEEEGCNSSFRHQMLPTEELYINHYIDTCVRTAFILELNGDFYVEILMNGDKVECYLGSKKVGIKSYMHDISESDFIDGKILIDKITECIRHYKTSYLNQDEKDDTEEYHFIQRFNQTIYSFDIGDGFIVDACNFKDGLAFYLSHTDLLSCTLRLRGLPVPSDRTVCRAGWA